jgi:hypothetical protein
MILGLLYASRYEKTYEKTMLPLLIRRSIVLYLTGGEIWQRRIKILLHLSMEQFY